MGKKIRNSITDEQAKKAYFLSKLVFERKITQKEAIQQLVDSGMNRNSAGDYHYNFKCLVEGKEFPRTSNAFSMDFFMQKIQEDYSEAILANALKALWLHIVYYEGLQDFTMHKMRAIHEKYRSLLSSEKIELEEDIMLMDLIKNRKSTGEVLRELLALEETDAEIVLIDGRAYKRDLRAIVLIKYLRESKCQICSTQIIKRDGSPYIEAAHIVPKHKAGRETLDNILLLCPNHHKEFDLGNMEIIKHDKEKILFLLNGFRHEISFEFSMG